MEKLVEVSDQEVQIDFTLHSKCRATVSLRSLISSCHVAFKVQTSSPHKFLVNPPSGLVPPLSYTTFQLILKPQSTLPSRFPRSPSDRFLIKTVPALNLSESSPPDFINSLFSNTNSSDIRLGVAFVGPMLLRHAVGKGDVNVLKKIVKRQRSLLPELSAPEAESLLRLAAGSDNAYRMTRLLLEAGLYRAAENGDRRMVNVMMELGMDPSIGSLGRGRLPLDDAEVMETLEHGEAVLTAARRADSSHLEQLLNRGVSVTWRDQYGLTALHVASMKGHKDIVTLLLQYNSELDSRDNEGHTPLHLAVEGGCVETVEILLNRGADLNAKSKKGATPLYIAQVMGYDDIYKFLSQRGACDSSLPPTSTSLSFIL